MENKARFVVVLIIVLVLFGVTFLVYNQKYGEVNFTGFAVKEGGEVNWPLIALIGQWLLLLSALVIASFHYLSPYSSKY